MPPLYSDILFAEALRQLTANPLLTKNLQGRFLVRVLQNKKLAATWYLVFTGGENPPYISQTPPPPTATPSKQQVENEFELEDKDLLKLASGGLNGIQAITEKRVKVKGDLKLARQVQRVFLRAGGVQRVLNYIRETYPERQGNNGKKGEEQGWNIVQGKERAGAKAKL